MSEQQNRVPVYKAHNPRHFQENQLGIFVSHSGAFDLKHFKGSQAYQNIQNILPITLSDNHPVKTHVGQGQSASHIFAPLENMSDDDLLKKIIQINKAFKDSADAAYAKVRVMPNWYGAGSPAQPIGGGGPGASAVAATFPTQPSADTIRQMLRFNLPNALWPNQTLPETPANAQPINVFILDSVPRHGDLSIGQEWDSNALQARLDQTFANAAACTVKVYTAASNGITLPPEDETGTGVAVDDHDTGYALEMGEHGLFITGTIYGMAQDYHTPMNIHLIEVMNRFGVTSYNSVVDALNLVHTIVQQTGPNVPFVVNMSLIFCTPLEAALLQISQGELDDLIQVIFESNAIMADITTTNAQHGVMIASAGNDYSTDAATHGKVRPPSRFPAAAKHVIGVGALSKDRAPFKPADYSNLADRQAKPDERIWTLGGNYANTALASSGGIFGLAKTDYQWWAGTSFAAGVVSGTLAVLLSKQVWKTKATVMDYLFDNCGYFLDSTSVNPRGLGSVLDVTQG